MKVKSGIPGLDELISGGFPKGSLNTVSGEYGVGKSTMAMQYIINGIEDHGEPGVFVTFERDTDVVSREMRRFGWHLKTFQNEGNLRMIGGPLDKIVGLGEESEAEPEDLLVEIVEVVDEMDAERLSIDGLGQFSMLFPDELSYRTGLASLGRRLNDLGCTTLATTEIGSDGKLARSGVEEYVVDGALVLTWETNGSKRERALEIRKMRGAGHSNCVNRFEITDDGIVIRGDSNCCESPGPGCEGGSSNPSNITNPGEMMMSREPGNSTELKTASLKTTEVKTMRKNIWECDLCGRSVDEPRRISGGGRATFCDDCVRKLERAGYLEVKEDGSLDLRKSLFDILVDYSSL